jgi:23S rRNA (guanine1835-N2)-methyltransferase
MQSEFIRYPIVKNDLLRAWDSADELLVGKVRELHPLGKKILILNDSFGYITIQLKEYLPVSYSDSFLSTRALEINSNNLIHSVSDLSELVGQFDLVLARIPKNLSFFEDCLIHLSQLLRPQGQLICTSMLKHLPSGAFDLIQKYIGQTTTSLAQKKARLIFATLEKSSSIQQYPKKVKLDGFEKLFTHHSNIFSREKLDIGTRFFLEHLPKNQSGVILDLGCANGVVGIKTKLLNPEAKIIFSDESFMAIQSAKTNYAEYFNDEAEFVWTHSFETGKNQSVDLVLCNPPFHAQHTVGDFLAWEMFKDAKRVLKSHGRLIVIGNRHLNYHLTLKKLFSDVQLIDQNSKFVILSAS